MKDKILTKGWAKGWVRYQLHIRVERVLEKANVEGDPNRV